MKEGIYIFLLLLLPLITFGQEESFTCRCCESSLKEQFLKRKIDYLHIIDGGKYDEGKLSSSFLMPTGAPPKIVDSTDEVGNDFKYARWTCTYSAGNISDGNPKTAWVEGVKGYGVGEVVITSCVNLSKPVKIWIGYGKSDNTFKTNSRPKKLKLHLIEARNSSASQVGYSYTNCEIISDGTAELKDINGYQALLIPDQFRKAVNEKPDIKFFLGVEIVQVYPGSKYEDTCISEIVNQNP